MATKIQKVQSQPNFPELEERINKFWKENKTFEKSVEQRDIENSYSFVDGPPFVSGMPHYGHLLTSVAKDVVPRYWTMRGKRVRRVWGWDCHGLPIEEKVNKKFKIKSSAQLEEEMGVEKYVQECRKWVESTSDDWKWYIEKIGRWVDMDNAYYTMHPTYMESVIWAFKQMYEKGYVYKGKRLSLFSTDTSTPVSNFEVAMDADNYRDVDDLSVFVKFPLKDHKFGDITKGENVYIVAWTTTPWTIPANTAIAVNPNVDYVLVKFEGEFLVIAKPRLEYTFHTKAEFIGEEVDKLVQILKEFKGTELEGISYSPVYNFFDNHNPKDFKLYLYEGVTIEDGTGVLHLAPAFGEEDFNLGKEHELSANRDIDEEGKMTVGDWIGIYLRDASPMIAEDMQKKERLLRSEVYRHRLPFYRGENPLIYMAQDSYFVNIQKIKDRMLELNKDINWMPEHIKEGRFGNTISTSPDWAISRNRYWATIMPIWRSDDGDEIVVGSFEEMTALSDQIQKKEVNGKFVYEFEGKEMDLHRDVADKIVLKKNGKEYHRIPEVLDCWMDSGSVPFAEHHYPFENKDAFEKAFPADFIVEYVGQVRAWFNVLHRISTMTFDTNAFKNVICTGVLAGNDGRKMSKSYGNYPDPKDILEKIGGEAVRLYLMGSPLMVGGDMNWSDEALNEQTKNILIPVWNIYKYLSIYADMHSWNPQNSEFKSNNILDKWLETYLNKVTLEYSKAIESYNIPESVRLIQPAVDNISSWWIRRSRDRFVEGNVEALQTLYAAIVRFAKTFAPQMPFVTEEIYQNLVVNTGISNSSESIHLENYPSVKESMIDNDLLNNMDLVRRICTLGLKVRDDNRLKLRQPLSKAVVFTKDNKQILSDELKAIIRDELNVKEVEFVSDNSNLEGFAQNSDNEITVGLDTNITSELKEEGLLNELTRAIQNMRKTSGLRMGEIVSIKLQISSEEIKNVVVKYNKELSKSVSASVIEIVNELNQANNAKIEGQDLKLEFQK